MIFLLYGSIQWFGFMESTKRQAIFMSMLNKANRRCLFTSQLKLCPQSQHIYIFDFLFKTLSRLESLFHPLLRLTALSIEKGKHRQTKSSSTSGIQEDLM